MYSFAECVRDRYRRQSMNSQCEISSVGIFNGKLYGFRNVNDRTGFVTPNIGPKGRLIKWNEKAGKWMECKDLSENIWIDIEH